MNISMNSEICPPKTRAIAEEEGKKKKKKGEKNANAKRNKCWIQTNTKSPVGWGMEKLEDIRDFSFPYLSLVEGWKSGVRKTSLFA